MKVLREPVLAALTRSGTAFIPLAQSYRGGGSVGELRRIGCACNPPNPMQCAASWIVDVASDEGAIRHTVIESCCGECGIVLAPFAVHGAVTHDFLTRLRGREAVLRSGDATSLRLASWPELGVTVGDSSLIAPASSAERINLHLAPIPEIQLRALVRRTLRLSPTLFPRVVVTADTSSPSLILHEGLVVKLASTRDPNHFKLLAKTVDTVQEPLEVWYGVDDRAKPVVRFLAKYHSPVRGAAGIVTHLVVMERETRIALTSYIRREAQTMLDRRGTLRSARWAAPPADG